MFFFAAFAAAAVKCKGTLILWDMCCRHGKEFQSAQAWILQVNAALSFWMCRNDTTSWKYTAA